MENGKDVAREKRLLRDLWAREEGAEGSVGRPWKIKEARQTAYN